MVITQQSKDTKLVHACQIQWSALIDIIPTVEDRHAIRKANLLSVGTGRT
jgi:hypothetical protein